MYRVELYARVRRACRVEGMSTREALAGVRAGPQDGTQDAVVLGAARVSPKRAAEAAKAGSVHGNHRSDLGRRSDQPPQATAHCEAHLRPSPGRVRVHRRLHHPDRVKTLGGDGDGGLGNHDLRRSHVIWRFGAGSPVEGAPGLRGSMCGARFWLDSRLMPSRRRSRREHLPARSRGGCCKPAP